MIRETASKTPTEIHVFLNLRYGYPLSVVVNDEENGLWFVRDGKMMRSTAPSADARSNATADQ
jgi:hypothetical protein